VNALPPPDHGSVAVSPVTKDLYAKRQKIHPMRVKGRFRRLKWAVMAVTLSIYYLVPWIRWDRGVGAPDQAVLIDFSTQRFYFFFIEIWPQEFYYITGLLIMAALGLFLVTSVVGRAWCGYACPQTVWTDLFVAVERFIEGDRNARIRLDRSPLTFEKLTKRAIKFALWILIAVGTGGAWVFYFRDAPTLAVELATFTAPAVAYATIAILTATTFVLGGFAREQVCIYMCPWPRIQGAMMDEESLLVTYRADRGEPRGSHAKGDSWEGRGDCVDCRQCVSVCPTGVDIRNGQQLGCITCALCIDACDSIMDKVGRPRGLIAYDTVLNTARREQGLAPQLRVVRPRTVIYGALWGLVGLIMVYVLLNRADVELDVLHDRNPLVVTLSDGSLRNGYTLKILNKAYVSRSFSVAVEGLTGATLTVVGEGADHDQTMSVERDRVGAFRIFISAARDAVGEHRPIELVLREEGRGEVVREETVFWGKP
jgi:cytochrome c oxidase accessory protein FixG